MGNRRLGNTTKEILRWIGTGALLYVALGSPVGAGKLSNLVWKESKKVLSSYVRRRLREMEKAGYIKTQGGTIKLTSQGQKLLARSTIEDISFEKQPKWDHKWRCVAYDIPNTLNKSREYFRATLKHWGFYQIQKSVFVFPYPCTEEVALAAKLYSVEQYVLIMEANDLPTSEKLKRYFSL